MSSSDIEDVLSSIRRLVTEDLRPRAAVPVAEPAEAAAGKLVLTPALRVVAPEPVAEARPPMEDVLTIIGSRVAPPPAGFEAETGDRFDAGAERLPLRPVMAFSQPVPQPAAQDDAFGAMDEAAIEAEFAVPPVDDGAFGGQADDQGDEAFAGDADEDVAEADVAEAAPDLAEEPGVVGAYGVRVPEIEAEPEVQAEAEDDTPPPVVDLDEETLRELIRDVLREELQGPMGERITRNIRKLVRGELARAVAMRGVD